MMRLKKSAESGFSLLEVMIAVSIMTVAFSAILTSQSGSINIAMKSRDLNIAGWLAHNKMVDSEHLMEGKPFTELNKGPEIEKFEAPFDRFQWKREVKELKFPDLFQSPSKDGSGIPEPVRLMSKAITTYLNKVLRELVVTVSWQRGSGEQQIVLSTYLVDFNEEFSIQL